MRTIEDFIYTGNVKIIALPQREISDESVYPEVVGKTGKVVRISGEKVGVLIDGKDNPYSRYGCYWFTAECLEFVNKENYIVMDRTMDMDLYKKAMEVGYLFNKKYQNDYRTEDWTASEGCSYFCKKLIQKAEKYGYSMEETFEKYAEKVIKKAAKKEGHFKNHMWDEYCKGFLAGQILGLPTEENMKLLDKAEKLWEDTEKYGYYQEALDDAVNKEDN